MRPDNFRRNLIGAIILGPLIGCLISLHCADDVPAWVLRGVLSVESSSHYDASGSIVYVNQTRGKDGERGPFQVLEDTFDRIAQPGERFVDLDTDMAFAQRITIRLLQQHYAERKSWILALSCYRKGVVCRTGKNYAHRVAWRGHNS